MVNQFLGFNYWNDRSGSLGNKVLLYRIEHGIFLSELAKSCGVSKSTIVRVEKSIPVVSEKKYLHIQLMIKQNII